MSSVAVFPESPTSGRFRAVSGSHFSTGSTIGEALDQLTRETGFPKETSLVIVQPMQPDRFFTTPQRDRLGELMFRWRTARDSGMTIDPAEQTELNELVDAELTAAIERTRDLSLSLPQ